MKEKITASELLTKLQERMKGRGECCYVDCLADAGGQLVPVVATHDPDDPGFDAYSDEATKQLHTLQEEYDVEPDPDVNEKLL